MLPNFFIVGTPKAGTTSLYHYLVSHPQVYMSPVKEPNYFSYEETVRQNLYYKERGVGTIEKYTQLFDSVKNEPAIGEASVSYLFYKTVPEAIKEKVPEAKIIILLRNPVERAFSHYYMDRKFRYIKIPFEDVLYKRRNGSISELYYQQYIELGYYYEQVKRYIDTFGANQVKIFLYDDLKSNLNEVINELYDFLGIDKKFMPDLNKKYNSYEEPRNLFVSVLYSKGLMRDIARKLIPSKKIAGIKRILFSDKKEDIVQAKTLTFMKELYRADIQKLELLLKRDLKHWYE